MEFRDIVRQRYATKEFDARIIPEEKINELFERVWLGIRLWRGLFLGESDG